MQLCKELLTADYVYLMPAVERIEIRTAFDIESQEVARHPHSAHLATGAAPN
ncbi:unannotated protein [freshwater metagenome]|uniref:Unannotated protein n=1 Tax=freshwater metagenome TaxID=449393 RepID=A0A6J6JWQ1_9ZZZZ